MFENMKFDFCDSNGNPFETIILAGENGTGKSTLLNAIFDFLNDSIPTEESSGKTRFVFQLTKNELLKLVEHNDFKLSVMGYEIGNELTVIVDHSITHNSNALTTYISRTDDENHVLHFESYILIHSKIFKSIFSDVDVNYTPHSINHTTSLDVDRPDSNTMKSTANLAQEITQLLIDIESLDNGDFSQWANEIPTARVNEGNRDIRMRRFKNAFESIFPTKKYKQVVDAENGKQILFEEFGEKISINDLSSGEKQIVFRGSFLLRNKFATEGLIVLIDEPEISLHPKW